MFDESDPAMRQASESAQSAFRYFWRELSWERRRIVPGLDMHMVKFPFTDGPRTDGNTPFEHMWVGEIGFDGNTVTGVLLNAPNWLTSVRQNDAISLPFPALTDWMMTCDGRAYGGFTVNLMRSRMGAQERAQHDQAWGLDFGDPSEVRVEIGRQPAPKKGFLSGLFGGGAKAPAPATAPTMFHDHPMCVNMIPKIRESLQADPSHAKSIDGQGWTLLHREALAGNLGVVQLLVEFGADKTTRTPDGRTATDLARQIGWPEISRFLKE
jgi:uncharacterized protein YegJ (DUF2314 family)